MLGSLEPPAAAKTILSFLKMWDDLLLERVDVGRQRSSSNVFANQEALRVVEYHLLLQLLIRLVVHAMERSPADCYDDCQNIPNPSVLDPMQNNLLLLDDCFLGKQNKAGHSILEVDFNNCDTIYIAQNYFRLLRAYSSRKFKLYYPVLTSYVKIQHISTLIIVLVIYLSRSSSSFAMEYGALVVLVIIS